MNPFPPGYRLTSNDGEKLGIVTDASPDPDHPGCVQIVLHDARLDRMIGDSGDWRVFDQAREACYCVQALRLQPMASGVGLLVSSLGELTLGPNDENDDFLVLPGLEPVSLWSFLSADGQCSNGPHVRGELDADDFRSLKLRTFQPNVCGCGRAVRASCGGDAAAASGRLWSFRRVGEPNQMGETSVCGRVVQLRQRSTTHCRFHVALPDAGDDRAVLIGHAVATERWAHSGVGCDGIRAVMSATHPEGVR